MLGQVWINAYNFTDSDLSKCIKGSALPTSWTCQCVCVISQSFVLFYLLLLTGYVVMLSCQQCRHKALSCTSFITKQNHEHPIYIPPSILYLCIHLIKINSLKNIIICLVFYILWILVAIFRQTQFMKDKLRGLINHLLHGIFCDCTNLSSQDKTAFNLN